MNLSILFLSSLTMTFSMPADDLSTVLNDAATCQRIYFRSVVGME